MVERSSVEVKYMDMSQTTHELIWVRQIFDKIRFGETIER